MSITYITAAKILNILMDVKAVLNKYLLVERQRVVGT